MVLSFATRKAQSKLTCFPTPGLCLQEQLSRTGLAVEEEEGSGEARKKEDAGLCPLTLKAVRPSSPSVGPDPTPKPPLTVQKGALES